jgi:RNA polymerase sigma-70 factor (ECF subfamily)
MRRLAKKGVSRRKDRRRPDILWGVSPVQDAQRRAEFEQLVAQAYDPLQRFLRRRTDPGTAEDVLGDVLLVLWRRVDEIPPEAPVAWAYGVARGCLANHVRGAARQERLAERLASEPAGGPFTSDHYALDEAMAQLPENDRDLLRLWAWEQLAPREIATVLGITPNAASIRLHRAIGKLKELMAPRKTGGGGGHLGERQERGDGG